MKKVFAICLLAMTGMQAFAQNGINSPYSRYGFGMMADRSMGFNKAMGGVAQGFRDGQEINPANPASYAAVDSMSALFDLGLSAYNGNYKMGNLQQNARNTSFDYFAFQFRARKGIGMAVGILPFTNTSYSFSSNSEQLQGNGTITSSYTFSGSGGIHKFFFGTGFQIIEPLSVGFNIAYLTGDYSHTSTMSFSQSSAYSMVRGYSADISTYTAEVGAQYTFKLNKKDKLTVGATYGLGHDIKNRAYRNTQTINSSAATVGQSGDTLKNAFQLPHTLSVGFAYAHANKWKAGADFTFEKWSDARFPADDANGAYVSTKGHLNDHLRLSAGGEYTPNHFGTKLHQRITYKFGGYYSQSYANADLTGTITKKPTEFGLSAGLSIPITNRNIWYNSPHINIGVHWVHSNIPYLNTQTLKQQTLTENYLKVSLGLTFNERWFYKYKVK